MFPSMRKYYALYTVVLLSADCLKASFISSTPAGNTIVFIWIDKGMI